MTTPYGYRPAADGKHVEEDPAEQAVIERARGLRGEGASLRKIGRALLDEGHAPRTGRKWHVQVLARMVGE